MEPDTPAIAKTAVSNNVFMNFSGPEIKCRPDQAISTLRAPVDSRSRNPESICHLRRRLHSAIARQTTRANALIAPCGLYSHRYSALMPAALMIGHHLAISSL